MLLDWVSVSYPKKLELSIDKKKALQQCLLRGRSGEAVPVPFTLARETSLPPVNFLTEFKLNKTFKSSGENAAFPFQSPKFVIFLSFFSFPHLTF